jgi:hypothetical protein
MDRLRVINIGGIQAPIGTPITCQGQEVGKVIRPMDEGYSECAINSDIVNQLIRSDAVSFSLEVIHK